MKLVRVDECVFVTVESVCAYGYVRMATERGGRQGRKENQIDFGGMELRAFFFLPKWLPKDVNS